MLHGTGIFTYIYHKFKPHVGKYAIHGAYGYIPTLPSPSFPSSESKIDGFQVRNLLFLLVPFSGEPCCSLQGCNWFLLGLLNQPTKKAKLRRWTLPHTPTLNLTLDVQRLRFDITGPPHSNMPIKKTLYLHLSRGIFLDVILPQQTNGLEPENHQQKMKRRFIFPNHQFFGNPHDDHVFNKIGGCTWRIIPFNRLWLITMVRKSPK